MNHPVAHFLQVPPLLIKGGYLAYDRKRDILKGYAYSAMLTERRRNLNEHETRLSATDWGSSSRPKV